MLSERLASLDNSVVMFQGVSGELDHRQSLGQLYEGTKIEKCFQVSLVKSFPAIRQIVSYTRRLIESWVNVIGNRSKLKHFHGPYSNEDNAGGNVDKML